MARSTTTVQLDAYPALAASTDAKGRPTTRWTYQIRQVILAQGAIPHSETTVEAGQRIGDVRGALAVQISKLLAEGHKVDATIVDQTGGGHRTVYTPRGENPADAHLEEFVVPGKNGLLGPRCIQLPRGARPSTPGRPQGIARQRTLTSTRRWGDLYHAVEAGEMWADLGAQRVAKSAKRPRGPGWIQVTMQMFQSVAMPAVLQRWKGFNQFGRFPAYAPIVDDLPGKLPNQLALGDVQVPVKVEAKAPKTAKTARAPKAPRGKQTSEPAPAPAPPPEKRRMKVSKRKHTVARRKKATVAPPPPPPPPPTPPKAAKPPRKPAAPKAPKAPRAPRARAGAPAPVAPATFTPEQIQALAAAAINAL